MTEQNYLEAFAYNLDYIMQDEGINQSELAKRSNGYIRCRYIFLQ